MRQLEIQKTANEERRAHEQHQRHRNFRHHQRVPQPGATAARGAARPFLQAVLEVALRRLKCRSQPEHDAREQRNAHGVGERSTVEAPVNEIRNHVGRDRGIEQAQASPRDGNAQRRRNQADHDRLGQQLAHDPQPSGAERGAYRNLTVSDRCAGEQQVCDVGAGDQEHERHRAHHREHHRLDLLGKHPLPQHAHPDAPVLVLFRIGRRELRGDLLKVGDGLFSPDVRPEPGEDLERSVFAGPLIDVAGDRHPEPLVLGKQEARRHDTDNGMRPTVDGDRATHDFPIGAVAPAPDLVAQDDDRFGAWPVVVGTEVASERWRRAEQPEQGPGDQRT